MWGLSQNPGVWKIYDSEYEVTAMENSLRCAAYLEDSERDKLTPNRIKRDEVPWTARGRHLLYRRKRALGSILPLNPPTQVLVNALSRKIWSLLLWFLFISLLPHHVCLFYLV